MAAVSRAGAGPWSPAGNSWSKWQVAVVVGAPLAVAGVSYWYYRKSGKLRNRSLSGSRSNGHPTSKTPSMEGPDTTLESIESMISNEKVNQFDINEVMFTLYFLSYKGLIFYFFFVDFGSSNMSLEVHVMDFTVVLFYEVIDYLPMTVDFLDIKHIST